MKIFRAFKPSLVNPAIWPCASIALVVIFTMAFGSVAFPFAWIGSSFGIVYLGYIRLDSSVLGKRSDGSIPWIFYLIHLPFHAFNEIIWVKNRWKNSGPAYARLTPDLYIGRRLRNESLPEGIKSVLDLTSEFSRNDENEVRYLCLPVLDKSTPPVEKMHEYLPLIEALPRPLYIHCAEGRGRSALVASIILLQQEDVVDADSAIELIAKSRPAIFLTHKQRQFIHHFSRENFKKVGAYA